MIDRFFLWLGAGVVAAGVTVGMLAGAGAAQAHTESDSDGGVKTSQAPKSDENKQDSGKNDAGQDQQQKQNDNGDKKANDPAVNADDPDATAARDVVRKDDANQNSRKALRSEAGKRTAKLINNFVAVVTPKPALKAVPERIDPVDRVEKVDPAAAADPVVAVETEPTITKLGEPEQPKAERLQTPAAAQPLSNRTRAPPTESDITLPTPMLAQPQVAAASLKIDVPPVVSAIGTAVFGLISFAEGVVEGPPKALPGSGVRVERSTLKIGENRKFPRIGTSRRATSRMRRRLLRSGSSICSTASAPEVSSTTTRRPTSPHRRTASSSPPR